MTTKTKRKHQPRTRFKLKLILLAFILGTIIATFYPMIWLAPPLFQWTPFVYIGLSFLWMPILYWGYQRIALDKVIKVLIIGCLLSSMFMMIGYRASFKSEMVCYSQIPQHQETILCSTMAGQCNKPTFIRIGNIMIAQKHPFDTSGVFYFCLF